MDSKNEVFEYLIDQLRQQVTSNPYKQQCEDLAHEVQSLKNKLRDASVLVAELQSELNIAVGTIVRLRKEVAKSTGGVQEYVDATEQSGCRKEDTQECHHNWRFVNGKAPAVCINCGVAKSSECEHDWEFYYPNGRRCGKCGVINL